jgi:phosphohistidine phosphatase
MELYIIRHAIAQQLGSKNDFLDEKRVLTAEGRAAMKRAARGLRALGVEFDLIITSPLARALETAEIIADAVGLSKKDVEQSEHLAPGGSTDELFAEIKRRAGAESVALVGHQPDLGNLISTITVGNEGMLVELKKGGVCLINVVETVPAVRGELKWLLTPRQLRLLAKA